MSSILTAVALVTALVFSLMSAVPPGTAVPVPDRVFGDNTEALPSLGIGATAL
jgi:hypothetical protein